MPAYSISRFAFLTLARPDDPAAPPDTIGEKSELLQRHGVDGTGVLRVGRKGEAFEMISMVDAATFTAAIDTGEAYKVLENSGLYDLVWHGVNYRTAYGNIYLVKRVRVLQVKRLANSTGGLFPPSLGLVVASWQLLPMKAI